MLHSTYGSFGNLLLTKGFSWTVDAVKLALLTSAYTPDFDAHTSFATSCAGSEITGTGYGVGGKTLAGKSLAYDAATNKTQMKADPSVNWTASVFTCRYAVLYSTITGTPLISLVDFQTDVIMATASTLSVQWPGGVVLAIAAGSA